MPAYNSEKYIKESIESILNQTFKDFEFIIINDGSTDNTAKIVKEYTKKDKRIKFINNKKNQGIVTVLNQGLNVAGGEYIARMDADDISLPERFAEQVNYMDTHKECAVVSGGYEKFGAVNETIIMPKHVKILDLLETNRVSHPLVMIRKSVIDIYKFRYDIDFQCAEDYDLWTRIITVGHIDNIDKVLLKYRVHDNNISVASRKQQLKLSDKIRQRLIENLTDNNNMRLKISSKYNMFLFGFIPLFRVKQKRIYLFCFIPFLKLHNNWWNLFDVIPFIKNKGVRL